MGYLKSGVFTYKTPLGQVHYEDPDGKPGCDFFGINHYARCRAASVDRLASKRLLTLRFCLISAAALFACELCGSRHYACL